MRTSCQLGPELLRALFVLSSVGLVGCGARGGSDESTAFSRARGLVLSGNYTAAATALENYLERFPRGKHASRGGLMLGKAHLGLGDLEKAKRAFEAVVKDFPSSLEAHKCRYKLALVAWWEGDTEEGRRLFQSIEKTPGSPLRAEAGLMARFLEE